VKDSIAIDTTIRNNRGMVESCTNQGDSSFTSHMINRKNYETFGLHSLDIGLRICAINFAVSFRTIKFKIRFCEKKNSYTLTIHN
jgi:hypothetical protein